MLIIFVGDSPSPRMTPGAPAFQGAACESRLKEWIATLLPEDCTYQLINRVDKNFEEIKNAQAIFIALGVNASRALKGVPHCQLPHPSGLNRKLNDKEWLQTQLQNCKLWILEQTKC